ncbi:MFS transporter [Streptomyces melanogenes]|uniref:MFS transporter n=1 Tax=Streptomyces melanogenes TaxID=67326 RepID=A0ABZ1XSP2_9ACTN|nr:MFS transporter [Streptomyces melanogenes]
MTATTQTPAPPSPPATRAAGLLPVDPVLRRLAVMTSLNSFGNGLFFPVSVLYFTRVCGIGATHVGFGLTVAGLFGVAAGIPAGRASDRWGSRRVIAALWLGCGATMAAYSLVDGYAGFLVAAICYASLNQASWGVKSALFADVLPAATRVEARGYLRMVTNVTMGAGGAIGAVALQADTRAAYLALILVNAATYMVPAVLVRSLPLNPAAAARDAQSTAEAPAESRWRAVRDLPYLAVTVLNAVTVLQFSLLEVGMPLWIVENTDAPRWSVAVVMIVNCVLVALLQVRATRGASDVPGAVRAMGRAGLLLGAACVVFALSAGLSPLWAVAVLAAGAMIQVFGEVLSSAGGWTLGYELADSRAQGVYQGVFSSGSAVAMMAGPALVTVTAVGHGFAGWACLAALFATAGLAVRPAVRWAERDGEWRGER